MALIVKNQTPAYIKPEYIHKAKGPFNPENSLEKGLIHALLQPLSPTMPVIVEEDGKKVEPKTIANAIYDTFQDVISANAEASTKELLKKTMVYYDAAPPIRQLFATQAGVKHKLSFPTSTLIYTASTDIIPTCKSFLADLCDEDMLLANFAFFTKSQVFGVWCKSETDFNDLKDFVKTEKQNLSAMLPSAAMSMLDDFDKLQLDKLTEALILRNDIAENNEEFSFARVIVWLIMKYITNHQNTNKINSTKDSIGLLPLDLQELYIPKTLAFINIDRHAHETPHNIAKEWELINNALAQPLQIMNKNQITRLGATQRQLQQMQNMTSAWDKRNQTAMRLLNKQFSSNRPSLTDFIKHVRRKLKTMENVVQSQNTYATKSQSFLRPNRRNPMDANLMGAANMTNYKPDIHLYVDTSGSISEEQYQDAVKACIALAKSLNVDFYFNSFSHVISDSSKLNVKGRSIKNIYANFQRINKVTGGTDFANVWQYINDSAIRKKEFSLMITDFEWTAPANNLITHPQNLYYTASSKIDWRNIKHYAGRFVDSAKHLDPMMRTRILF